jgi:hypothetical protein
MSKNHLDINVSNYSVSKRQSHQRALESEKMNKLQNEKTISKYESLDK